MQVKGFTLIELLVVLLVLSLVMTVAVFSIGVFESSHNLENTTQALRSRLHLAQMEATYEQDALGIALDEHGYRFFRKDSTLGWKLISDDSFFKPQDFPDNTVLKLTINGQLQSLDQTIPQIILQQGELAPFSLTFKDSNNKAYEITLDGQGEVVWSPL